MNPGNYMTAKEAAEELNITPSRVRAMIRDGVLAGAQKVGRDWLVPRESVENRKKNPVGAGWKKGRSRMQWTKEKREASSQRPPMLWLDSRRQAVLQHQEPS